MKKDIFITTIIYFAIIFLLYQTVEHLLDKSNFIIMGSLIFVIATVWSYLLFTIIFKPQKDMEKRLLSLSKDIIHELNIPLATIQANSSMLHKSMPDEKSIKRIRRIEESTKRLKKLYNELVYGINKEIHIIEKEQFNIKELVENRIEIFQEQQRNIFKLSIYPYIIIADKIGFEQSFDNLISNAMKYSSKGSTIEISLEDNRLVIRDQGVGMSETELLLIYERYYQVDSQKYGEGIGLALVKSYCDEEDIDIIIESKKDIGTVINLNLFKVRVI